jgi:hypothetical protein
MIVEDREQDLTETFKLPSSTRLIHLRAERYSSPERHIQKIELESAAQHRRLTNDLIDLNWARFGAREDVGEGSE